MRTKLKSIKVKNYQVVLEHDPKDSMHYVIKYCNGDWQFKSQAKKLTKALEYFNLMCYNLNDH